MKKYKIISSTDENFLNIEMPFDFEGKNIGDSINVFGKELTITQTGTVFLCVNETNVMTFQEVPEVLEVINIETEDGKE